MTYSRVKICGITRPEDAIAAEKAGADAIGLVFYDKSARAVDLDIARAIVASVGPFIRVVGLFVNPAVSDVKAAIAESGVDLLQFHGDEDEAFCRQFNRPYLKAIRMHPDRDPAIAAAEYPTAKGILFDAWNPDKYGGTGESFDWQRVPSGLDKPVILAGGLTPDNVARAVMTAKPYAVDVSGGVELSPGIKSEQLVRDFINNARAAN